MLTIATGFGTKSQPKVAPCALSMSALLVILVLGLVRSPAAQGPTQYGHEFGSYQNAGAAVQSLGVAGAGSSCLASSGNANLRAVAEISGIALLQRQVSRLRTDYISDDEELEIPDVWKPDGWQPEVAAKKIFEAKIDQEQLKFFSRHWSLVVAVILILIIFICLVAFDFFWEKQQARMEHESTVAARSSAFSLELVRNLLPSAHVENYQFRGMVEKTSSLSVQCEQVGLEIPGRGMVLEGVTGELKEGHLTAIMGPSGSGKTTFMNVLCGKAGYGKTTGEIRLNGEKANLAQFKPVTGYVPQDDIVHEHLTVREQIDFSAQLRNPAGTGAGTLKNIVDDVLAVLQIEHIQRSIVGGVEARGISGGQRKRVNIGLELAAFPTLLFLDEPTSGLDSTTSLAIVRSLKKMTQLGITIVMVIHQPRQSLLALFDDVLLLAKGGHTVYLGSSNSISPYFEGLGFKKPLHENPADWYVDIVSGSVPCQRIDHFRADMLPGLWEKKDSRSWAEEKRETPEWTDEDDCTVLARALEDEWEKVCPSTGRALTPAELKGLLGDCAKEQPEEEVVQEVVARMAGVGAKEITKDKFVSFFMGLRGVVAHSYTSKPHLQRASTKSLMGNDPDLNRVLPGCFRQYLILLRRRLVHVRRLSRQRLLDIFLIVSCACFLGFLHRGQMGIRDPQLASKLLIFHLALSLLTVVSCLRVFGTNWPLWYRECSSGLNVLASFCARLTVDTLDVFLHCVLFTAMYYLLAQPKIPFRMYFLPCLLVSFASSGWGYFISAVAPPQNAILIGLLFVLVSCGFLANPVLVNGMLAPLSITRWSVQMTYLGTADAEGSPLEALKGQLPPWLEQEVHTVLAKHPLQPLDILKACGYVSTGYTERSYRMSKVNQWLGSWYGACAVLLTMSLLLRYLAYIGLRFGNSAKKA